MNESLLTEFLTEKQEVPEELKERIHKELLKQEKAIMIRNITVTLAAVFVLSFFVISFAYVFLGNILSLVLTAAFSVGSAVMAVVLAVAAGKYEIRELQKGLL